MNQNSQHIKLATMKKSDKRSDSSKKLGVVTAMLTKSEFFRGQGKFSTRVENDFANFFEK